MSLRSCICPFLSLVLHLNGSATARSISNYVRNSLLRRFVLSAVDLRGVGDLVSVQHKAFILPRCRQTAGKEAVGLFVYRLLSSADIIPSHIYTLPLLPWGMRDGNGLMNDVDRVCANEPAWSMHAGRYRMPPIGPADDPEMWGNCSLTLQNCPSDAHFFDVSMSRLFSVCL